VLSRPAIAILQKKAPPEAPPPVKKKKKKDWIIGHETKVGSIRNRACVLHKRF
jgi:hypothetical protein